MAKSHFKWNKAGYEELQRSEVGRKAVSMYADQVAARANSLAAHEGAAYEAEVHQGTKGRRVAFATVSTVGADGAVDNAYHNTLAKAIGGA